ncbi:hypothetical protein BGX38DRAFT_1167679 [Terfezia claveryi]|nr:hypothetical protein BGX38DRAFT_1167679 [Terfezia claveryi]
MPSNTSQFRTEVPQNTPVKEASHTVSHLSLIQATRSSHAQQEAASEAPSPPRPRCGEFITVCLTPEDPALQEALHYAVRQGWVCWWADYATLHFSLQQTQNELADIHTIREEIHQREKKLDTSKMSLNAREKAVAVMEKGVQEQHRVLSLKILELASNPSTGSGRGRRRSDVPAGCPRKFWNEGSTRAGVVLPQRGVPGEKGGRLSRRKWWEFWNMR